MVDLDLLIQVLKRAAEDDSLVKVALNTHGTRAVQKLIETLQGPEQVLLHHNVTARTSAEQR